MNNLPGIMVQVAHRSPTSFNTMVLLMSGCVMPLGVANHGFWEGGPCPQAERGCESCRCLGVAGGEGQGWGLCLHQQGGITCPQHNVLSWLYLTYLFL